MVVSVEVRLYDFYGNVCTSTEHVVDPEDILIRHIVPTPAPHRYLLNSGSPEEKIDVAIVAEGYTADETEEFYGHAMDKLTCVQYSRYMYRGCR